MPAESKSQQRFMGMVHAYQKGELKDAPESVKKAAKSMTKKAAKDFAKTKHKGLPEKVREDARVVNVVEDFKQMTFSEFLQLDEGPLAFAAGAGRELGRKVAQSAPVRAVKDIYAAGQQASRKASRQELVPQALAAGEKARQVVIALGPEGEKMLAQMLQSMGPQGQLGLYLYNIAKARAARDAKKVVNTAGNVAAKTDVASKAAGKNVAAAPAAAAQPPAKSSHELNADAARAWRTNMQSASFELQVLDKEFLNEAIGAFVKGMAKAAVDKAGDVARSYAERNPLVRGFGDIWRAGKAASQQADAKKKLADVAKELVRFAVALQKAGVIKAAPAQAGA